MKTNRDEHNTQQNKNTHRHEAFLHEGLEHVWPDSDQDVPEVHGWDGAAVGSVPPDQSLSRMFQLHLLWKGEERRKEGSLGIRSSQ